MMKRQKIYFSARLDTDEELGQVAARVGQALNCTFARGEFQRGRAEVSKVFGLKISLVGVFGIGGKDVVKLVGSVGENGFLYAPDGSDQVEYDRVDISDYLVDLLTIRTGLQWYRPTPEDRAAERKAARGYDDWLGGVGTQGWTSADEEKFGDW
ncbi:hypothetical protein SAMN05192558_10960 [Actinokineospora alba]|uniref:Uncharacterized protein n=2 Tax=Actinokineospora alba TaxID=504798 RepID=A0A1H0SRG8_9PSEU|nr:hypothetical protein C8E96_2084 [Actinokineospora alba]SDP44341.1 hypothetical protein SAMN05192558_10960 [Actinokineospora alba]